MVGPDSVLATGGLESADPEELGLIPRACQQLFDDLYTREAQTSILVQCGYLEVYNDRIHDLLGEGRNLKLRERKSGIGVEGLAFELTPTADDVMHALWRGNAKVTLAHTRSSGTQPHPSLTLTNANTGYGSTQCNGDTSAPPLVSNPITLVSHSTTRFSLQTPSYLTQPRSLRASRKHALLHNASTPFTNPNSLSCNPNATSANASSPSSQCR